MKKILLVEDNEHIMRINAEYLSGKGYELEKAYSLRQAEEKIAKGEPDLIVLDVMLPDGDGIRFCGELRKEHHMPILFLTAKVQKADIIAGLGQGGDDYLTKPYDLDEFGMRIEALLRRAKPPVEQFQSYEIGPLRFDMITSRVFINGEELNLTGKEFALLFCLAHNKGRVVSKEELCETVWGVHSKAEDAMLWTTLSRLKKKLTDFEDRLYLDSDHSGYELILTGSN